MPFGPSLVRRVDLVPRDYIYARVQVLPVLAIDLPVQARCWDFGLAGRGSTIAMPRSMRGGVNNHRKAKMARKPATPAEFTLFDFVYEACPPHSNRRVPSHIHRGLRGAADACAA